VAVGWRGKGAIGLIEDDVLRDQLGVRGEIEAPVALMLRIVAKEDTTTGEEGGGGELMGSSGRKVEIADAPEDTKVGVRGSGAKDGKCSEGSVITLVGRWFMT
jgi:hypothetical protein